ncbi:hypothetical protein O181_044669 [Austropuccinia psidii MF-1]|uniref:Uncharacterized protein n=1 Tax=Austropuccinia psidii MF-1 TaxID=1389203 RepID=A0A9Q3HJL8_9BASI|nr:hypothetical protein [Austropuccinia psidii MF-1]
MVHPHSVPVAPDTSLLQQFNTRFKTPEEIHRTAESETSVPLIPQSQVLTLKGVHPRQKKFGVANNFPKQYLKILSETDAHSEDEYILKNTYKINKLDFRSQKANIFMRRVAEEIDKEELIEGKQSKRQNQIKIDSPNVSTNSQPPKGLQIDFYDPTWFNNCPIGKKKILADAFKVSFLPNASQSIRGVQHPDERLSHQNFTEKYWEINTEKYDLSHEIAREDEDSESDYNEAEIIEARDKRNMESEADDSAMEEEPEFSFS